MADEALRLNAVVVDQFTKPLQNLKNQIAGVTQAPALASMRKDWGNLTKEITGGARALQSSFLPALSGINVASLGAAGAVTGIVAAMRKMSETAVSAGIFKRSIDITGEKLKEMTMLGQVLGQSSEQTRAGLQGLYRTIDQLKNRYGQAFQSMASMNLGKEAMALGAAKTMSEAIEIAISIIRKEPNKERQRDIARAMGWEGLEVIANEASGKMLETVRKFARQTTGLSEQAAKEFNLNMLIMGKSAENLVNRSIAPMIPVVNELMAAVAPRAETLFTQLANDIPKIFKGLQDLSQLWNQGKYYEMFGLIERGTKMDLSVSKDSRAGALEKRLEILKERRGAPGFEEDAFEEKQLRKEIDELRGGRPPAPGAATGPQKEIADRQRRLEEIRELRTGPVASSLQSDLEKEEIKLREEIKKLRESIERGATTQQQGLQGGGIGAGGLIQPAALGGGGGFGAGRSFGGGRFGGLGGGGDGGGGDFGGVPGPSVPSIGGALGGPRPSGQSGIGPALGANDPVAGEGGGGGARGTKGWWTPARLNQGVEYLMKHAGLSRTGAQGLVSRWAGVESPGGSNVLGGYMGRATGIGQWLGPRKKELFSFSKQQGMDPMSYEAQLAFAAHELNTKEDRAKRTLSNPRSADEAAAGAAQFERAGGWNARTGRDAFVGKTLGTMRSLFGGSGGGSSAPDMSWQTQPGAPATIRPSGTPLSGLAAGAVDEANKKIGGRAGADIQEYLRTGGTGMDPRKRDWCAAFVNASLAHSGLKGLPEGLSRNLAVGYQSWGRGLQPGETVGKGDVLVKSRGIQYDPSKLNPDQWRSQVGGHVGLATGRSRMVGGRLQYEMTSGNVGGRVGGSWEDARSVMARRATENERLQSGDLLRAGTAGAGGSPLEAKGTVNIHLHDSMKDKNAKVNMDGMFQKVNVNRGRSMPTPDAPPI